MKPWEKCNINKANQKRGLIAFACILLCCILIPTDVYAIGFDIANKDADAAYKFLSKIFGTVGNVLEGGNELLGNIFKVFNIVVLTLGTIVGIYTLTVSTISTAQEGEVMGRKWSTLWVPLRALLGMGMLLPTPSGYSIIQIMMVWVIVQGSAAGNVVWNKISTYAGAHGGQADPTQAGWFYAGTQYFTIKLNQSQSNAPKPTGNPSAHQAHLDTSKMVVPASQEGGSLPDPPCSQNAKDFNIFEIINQTLTWAFDSIKDAFKDLQKKIINDIITKDPDPLRSMNIIGKTILDVVELSFTIMIILVAAIMLSSCVGAGISAICFVAGGVIAIIAPIFMAAVVLLFVAGAVYAIYIPLIPYIIFTFAAVGWLILCVEAMAAAPIVALGIITPAHEILGRAAPSVVILTNVYLRPSLMLIGFVAATKLLQAVAHILLETFIKTLEMSVGSYGIFAMIAVIALFSGFTVALYHKVLSLIYIIPDRITRWIGGQVEQSGIEKALQEARSATESSAGSAQSIMKSGLEASGKAGKEAASKAKTDMGGGFGKGGKSYHSKAGREAGYTKGAKGENIAPGGKKGGDGGKTSF